MVAVYIEHQWLNIVVVLLNHSYFWKRTSFKDESRCSYFSTIDISVVIERDDSTTELFERTELLYWVIVEVEVQIKDFSNRFSNPAMISCSLSADSFLWISAYAANASWILVSICSLVIPVAKNLYKKKGAAEQITVRTFFFFLMTNYGLPYPSKCRNVVFSVLYWRPTWRTNKNFQIQI